METGQYYLGRVVKLGLLNQKSLMDAIVECPPQIIGKFSWAITDIEDRRNEPLPYVFGKLSKYAVDGEVTIVDTTIKHQVPAIAKNLLIASSPFVYLPEFSGIAYLHVWNEIQEDVFPRRFQSLIEGAFQGFFVECTIERIADYRAFVTKLKEIERVTAISARVNPPNPLFGRLWKPLKDYIAERNASEITVKEQNKAGEGLKTDIVEIISSVVENNGAAVQVPRSITDAALLMAADGYGYGRVAGDRGDQKIVVRTSDTSKSFPFPKDPHPPELAKETEGHLRDTSTERDMKHP